MLSEFTVSVEAPCVQGHFPGMPLVPGAWLLGRADAALRQAYPEWHPREFKKVKFLTPLRPGQRAELGLDSSAWPRVKVRITSADGEVLLATALLSA